MISEIQSLFDQLKVCVCDLSNQFKYVTKIFLFCFQETQGVPVATLSFDKNAKFPSFFSSRSKFSSPTTIKSVLEAARLVNANLEINQTNGVLLAVPIPEEHRKVYQSLILELTLCNPVYATWVNFKKHSKLCNA